MELAQKIKETAETLLKNPAHFIVDVVLSKHKPLKVSIILDGDQGITIDDCSNLSRALSDELDSMNIISDPFTLEVGTPGLDQPLKLHRQYMKNKGRTIRVHTQDKGMLEGLLKEVQTDKILIEAEVKEKGKKKEQVQTEIFFNTIDKTLIMVSFK